MHIGFDISQTGTGKAGCGYLAHAMIKALLAVAPQHRYALYPSFGDFYFDPGMPISNPYRGKRVSYGPRHLTRGTARTFWNQVEVESALNHPDIIHSNNFWTPLRVVSSRLIYTLHDLSFTANPAWHVEKMRVGCFEGVFRSAVAADWVVAVSEYSRLHYLRLFPHFPKDRVRVVYPCSRFIEPARQGSPPTALDAVRAGEFWLSVGTMEPRKNQRMLADAYARYIGAGGRPMPLVLAGGNGWLMQDFKAYLAQLGIADRVILTGYVSDEELIWLYRNCYANLYPSLFEGFGLPVLEGMQFGAATLCSNATSIPEIAGEAAVMITPYDPEPWTDSMLEVASDQSKRQRLGAASHAQAAQFDWRRSAMSLLDIYDEAVRSPKRSNLSQSIASGFPTATPASG